MIDDYLRARLVETCTRLGLPPWETCIRPRLHADAALLLAGVWLKRADQRHEDFVEDTHIPLHQEDQ